MADARYDRLTQIDNSFLVYEDELPTSGGLHVASTQILEAAPLLRPDGTLDIERIEEYVLSRLDRIPRYRQRIARTPIEGHPVWVDDPHFDIRYHVRHSRLPRPGDERQLKRMVGRIFSQRLDREKPLWEIWMIEGLEGDRLAMVSKVHHCMVDGVSGSELISALLTPEPVEKPDPPRPWNPRPMPGRATLAAGEITRALQAPVSLGSAATRLILDRGDARRELTERVRAVGHSLGSMGRSTEVPFNRPVGPNRRIDWMTMSLERIGRIRKQTGATVNDVVLATAAGAMGRYLARDRGLDVEQVRFTVMAPVSVRSENETGALGNRVSAWNVELPIAERDPLTRLESICDQTRELKRSRSALGAETLTQVTEWTGDALLGLTARMLRRTTPFNMVVTNVPGPRTTLYLLRSRLLAIHPHVPLTGTLGLGIALFSYDGTLSWGYSADWDLVPDLHQVVIATQEAFEALEQAV
jgi:WS/DGAT/MGAT family acyltransferase